MLSKKRFYFKIEGRLVSHSSPAWCMVGEHTPWTRTSEASVHGPCWNTTRPHMWQISQREENPLNCWFVYNLANINCRW